MRVCRVVALTVAFLKAGPLPLSPGVRFIFNFSVPGTALIEGSFEGDLAADAVVVGVRGQLVGKVKARQADILGETRQDLHVSGKLIVRSSGRIHGSAMYGELEVERGGTLQGAIRPIALAAVTLPVETAVLPVAPPANDVPASFLVPDAAPSA